MTLTALALLAVLGLVAGISIGCIGIGGIILVPALTYLGGIPIQTAIAGAMMGYLLTGAVGTVIFARKKSIRWSMALWLCAGATPAALAGAWTSNNVEPLILEIVIGLLTISSGVQAFMRLGGAAAAERPAGRLALLAIGAATGFLSAISGTGGPLVLVPIMLWLGFPVLTAIGLSQAIQFPIATLATAGNILYGTPDFALGAILAVGLAAGSAIGAYLAHAVPKEGLKRLVAVVLILIGLLIMLRILLRLLGA